MKTSKREEDMNLVKFVVEMLSELTTELSAAEILEIVRDELEASDD